MSGRLQGVPSCHPRCLLDGRTWSKLENVNQMKSKHTIHDLIKNTLFVTQNTLFVNQMTQNNLFTAFISTVEKIITYALGTWRT